MDFGELSQTTTVEPRTRLRTRLRPLTPLKRARVKHSWGHMLTAGPEWGLKSSPYGVYLGLNMGEVFGGTGGPNLCKDQARRTADLSEIFEFD